MTWFVGLHALSFLIGSIPVGYLLARLQGVDIRQHGSGNTGATNVARTLGKKTGVATLLGDFIKGLAAAYLALLLPGSQHWSHAEFVELASSLGFIAIVGHCFSPFLRGRGGKGVATAIGVFMALAPIEGVICCVLFAVTFKITRYVSLGSLVATISMTPLIWLHLMLANQQSPRLLMVSAMASILIVLRHRANIARLAARTEAKFGSTARG